MALNITQTRNALLVYVARFGITAEADRRLLVARLWRAIPRGLNAAEAIVATDHLLGQWASQRLGFPVTAAQLRLAVLETGADARQLLADDVSGFIAVISPALAQPVPQETHVAMPVQSLAPASLAGLFAPALPAVARTA